MDGQARRPPSLTRPSFRGKAMAGKHAGRTSNVPGKLQLWKKIQKEIDKLYVNKIDTWNFREHF